MLTINVQDLVVLIGAIGGVIVSIISAIFAGWIALKQVPRMERQVDGNLAVQIRQNAQQAAKIDELHAVTLATAQSKPPVIVVPVPPETPPAPPS